MKYVYLLSIILSFLVNFITSVETCQTKFNCPNSACCKNNICVDADMCLKDRDKVYIAVGVIGAGFLIGTFIYFIISIRNTRANVRKIKENMKD
jgi:hypothetical protein